MADDGRVILHVDMDAFFVSVELLHRPELVGKTIIVGGEGRRGVVAAASYEARSSGVYSAMPSLRARQLCPHAVFLAPDHARYREASVKVMAVFESFTPLVEPISLDEAFLDVTGARRLHGDGREIAHTIRERIRSELKLPCSVGIAPNKFLAKLASEAAKPSPSSAGAVDGQGIVEVEVGRELEFLHPLPVGALWGVGPATKERLDRLGVATIASLAALPVAVVRSALGDAAGEHLHRLSNGIDDRAVQPNRSPKSIGHEETFAVDRFDEESIHVELVRMGEAVASRLRRAGLLGRTVTLKIRFGDFRTITRSVSPEQPMNAGPEILTHAKSLLANVDLSSGIRLLGLSVSGLSDTSSRQLSFDDVSSGQRLEAVTTAIDEIRDRFGDAAIGPAVLASRIRTARHLNEPDT